MTLTFALAQDAAQAAINCAAKRDEAICVAVCDGGGRLFTFSKMDGTSSLVGHEAIRRAIASAASGSPSELSMSKVGSASSAAAEGLGISFRPGGLPFLIGQECVGAVGVCGSPEMEVDCARAGVAAFAASGQAQSTLPEGPPGAANVGATTAGDPDFGSFGRFKETSVDGMPPPMRDAYDFTMKLRGQVPGPHKIWLANPKLSKTIVPTGAYFQTESTLSKAEIEIVTNVINSRWLAAYSNYEHEKIGEEAGHLPAEKVQALIANLATSFDDPRQEVIYQLAVTLAQPRVVPLGLYKRAKALIGEAGIVDVTVLMGWFTAVSLTLNAFDVPSDAVGLKQ